MHSQKIVCRTSHTYLHTNDKTEMGGSPQCSNNKNKKYVLERFFLKVHKYKHSTMDKNFNKDS